MIIEEKRLEDVQSILKKYPRRLAQFTKVEGELLKHGFAVCIKDIDEKNEEKKSTMSQSLQEFFKEFSKVLEGFLYDDKFLLACRIHEKNLNIDAADILQKINNLEVVNTNAKELYKTINTLDELEALITLSIYGYQIKK